VELKRQEEARKRSDQIIGRSSRVTSHPYLESKTIKPFGTMGQRGQLLVLPLRDIDGEIHSLQFINAGGEKWFLSGGRVKGCFYTIGYTEVGPIVICEGYATGASIHEATDYLVVCALFADNLALVAKVFRLKYPDREIIIAADNDVRTNGNPGVAKATSAAIQINAKLAVALFSSESGTDFNDLHQQEGVHEVKNQILTAKSLKKSVEEILEERRWKGNLPGEDVRVVYWIGNIPFATPGNLQTITSQVKTGKSALIGACIAAAIPGKGGDTLGITSSNPEEKVLLHFDTEQAPDDFSFHLHRALRRAGAASAPPWLLSYSFAGLSAADARFYMNEAVRKAARQCGAIHSILIDGAGDLVSDVNDPQECNSLVAQLHALAIEFDCPITSVIHFNPDSTRARGHLGSQLERKAETNLRLDKTGEFTRVWSEKQRRAPIPKGSGPRFKWCDVTDMHVLAETANEVEQTRELMRMKALRDKIFCEGTISLRAKELTHRISQIETCSTATADRRKMRLCELQLIVKNDGKSFTPSDSE
jgi:hypothetical protein